MMREIRKARQAGQLADVDPTAMSVLFLLADTCRDDTRVARIAHSELQTLTGLKYHAVSRAVNRLIDRGRIRRISGGNQHETSTYELPPACSSRATGGEPAACSSEATSGEPADSSRATSGGDEHVAFQPEHVAFQSPPVALELSARSSRATLPSSAGNPDGNNPDSALPRAPRDESRSADDAWDGFECSCTNKKCDYCEAWEKNQHR
jgi:hypothetical protein